MWKKRNFALTLYIFEKSKLNFMVNFLHWSGETKVSRPVCGARSGVRRFAVMAISFMACLYANNANAQNWTGSTPDAAKGKTVYLWNVGAKQFLGKGGSWGTEATISNVGTPFKLVASGSSYRLQSLVKGEGNNTTSLGCLGYMNGVNSGHDRGNFYVDRNSGVTADATTTLFTFTPENGAYTMKVTSSEGKGSDGNTSDEYIGTFNLVADMNVGKAWGVKTVASDSTAYSQWIIVTEAERKAIFEKAEASSASAVDATFLMFDEDFARNDNNVSYWKTRTTKGDATANDFDGNLSWTGNKQVTPSDAYPSETTEYTYTYTGSHTYTVWYTTYTHNVTYTVTTTTPPAEQPTTLTISCDESTTSASYKHTAENVTVTLDESKTETKVTKNDGYQYYNGNGYTDGATTYKDEDGNAVDNIHWQQLYGGDWTANIHGTYGVVNQTIPNANMVREGWYKVSCVGFTTSAGKAKLYASAGLAGSTGTTISNDYAEQTLKAISESERPATYVKASRLINSGNAYEASVLVYVGMNTTGENAGKPKTLSFGILVDGADANAWTCFDNFQVEYLGKPNTDLVLDEEQTSVDYINNQLGETTDDAQRTLYLHRIVNAGKWNSIVLPVDLTVGQVKSAFGDDTHISEFKGATNPNLPGRMYFEAVSVNRSDNNAVAIKAGKLYIIKPTASEPEGQEEKTFEATGDKTYTSYFMIPQVAFPMKGEKTFAASVEGAEGYETVGGGKVQFFGTYVANAEGEKLIPANSYVLRGNKDDEAGLWFYRTAKTSTKGFRGWLQTINAKAGDISFSINGVVDDATGIDGLTIDGTTSTTGVYNLNGQLVRKGTNSTEGLAKGIYVVGGRKVVVK